MKDAVVVDSVVHLVEIHRDVLYDVDHVEESLYAPGVEAGAGTFLYDVHCFLEREGLLVAPS